MNVSFIATEHFLVLHKTILDFVFILSSPIAHCFLGCLFNDAVSIETIQCR
jgi:hypothetical protein